MRRFIAFRWRPVDPRQGRICRTMFARIEARHRWATLIDRRGVLACVAGDGEPLHILEGEYGAIIGDVFTRAGAPIRGWEISGILRVVESRGDVLAKAYWGAYVALLHDRVRDLFHVVRDPAASHPVFWAELGAGAHVIFSHASDFVAASEESGVDEAAIAAFLVRPRLVSHVTGLKGVHELLAGERITLSRRDRVLDQSWAPRMLGAPPSTPVRFDAVASELRRRVILSAGAWADGRKQIVHRLSGGLDSSIALAALKQAGAASIACVTQYPAGVPEGDERHFARVAARHFGVSLVELEFAPEHVDYARLADVELSARPSLADLSFADTVGVTAIAALQPGLVTSGQGGDQLFHRSRQTGIAAEAVRDGAPRKELMRIAFETARLVRCPIWDVLAAMVSYGLLRRRSDPIRKTVGSSQLARDEAGAFADGLWAEHPWRAQMLKSGPARALRLSHIAGLQFYHEAHALSAMCPVAPILASQPVIEFCLGVAPYLMTQGGRERALARHAFAALLPPEILYRKGKGSTTRFHAAVLERQLPFIRAMLLGGELERRGLIVRDSLHRALAKDFVADGAMKDALTTAFVAEMWLRRLADALRTGAGARPQSDAGAAA